MSILRSATRFDQENWFQMVIDKDVPSCEVTGILDGEPIDFSGGEDPAYTLLTSEEFNVSTTSSSVSAVGTVNVNADDWENKGILFVVVRDKAGLRAGHFGFSMSITPYYAPSPVAGFYGCYVDDTGNVITGFTIKSGVYLNAVNNNAGITNLDIRAKYTSSTGIVDGTFVVDVYLLAYPPNGVFHL